MDTNVLNKQVNVSKHKLDEMAGRHLEEPCEYIYHVMTPTHHFVCRCTNPLYPFPTHRYGACTRRQKLPSGPNLTHKL